MGRYDGTYRGTNGNDYFRAHKKSFGRFGWIKRWGSWNMYGYNGNDTLIGGEKNDRIYGHGNNDRLYGLGGNDYISGGSGNDTLIGGNGNDTLVGGTGKDTLYDGAGYDKFKYYSTFESGVGFYQRDVIPDFDRGYDKIDLSSIDANRNFAGNQAFKFIGTRGFTGTAGEVRYYRSGSATIVQVDIQGDRNVTADMEIQLNNTSFISTSDFVL